MVQVELTPFEAMQVSTALIERLGRLAQAKPSKLHPLEASVVASGLQASKAALGKVTDALYTEPESADPITAAKGWTEAELRFAGGDR